MSHPVPRDLGDGLHLRTARPEDIPGLIDLHGEAFADDPVGSQREADEQHLRDLLERPHPSFTGTEMTVVEDTASGRIVSSQHLSHHTWNYGSVSFAVGEIEHVSTLPDRRRRGLVRAQTDAMHTWSLTKGELATVINGIPWYYTQFGYELPLHKHNGRRLFAEYVDGLPTHLPRFEVREAHADDIDFIHTTFAAACRRYLVSSVRSRGDWEYTVSGRHPANPWHRRLVVLIDGDRRAGFASVVPTTAAVDAFEVVAESPWSLATMSLARWLAEDPSTSREGDRARRSWSFGWLGDDHPAFGACPHLFGHPETLGTPFRRGAWYVRIPNLAAFVRTITPELERRLFASDESGYTGSIRVGRYRDPGVALHFDRGAITTLPWEQRGLHDGEARFAEGTFLSLLFGRESVRTLEMQFPYRVGVASHARPVLEALFPPRPSLLLPTY